MTRDAALRACAFAAAAALTLACSGAPRGAEAESAVWAEAEARWVEHRDPLAFRAWRALPSTSPGGREARDRLARADRLYRLGIARVRSGDSSAREAFDRAKALAPMDPVLYFPLARACGRRAEDAPDEPRLLLRAALYYRKFLLLAPSDAAAAEARRELEALDPDADDWLDANAPEPPPPAMSAVGLAGRAPATVLGAALLAFLAFALAIGRGRAARRTLAELTRARPELHPAIAYLISGLRHELLKHRVGAVDAAVSALASGRGTDAQRAFVVSRLHGGEPLLAAWDGHLRAFERALGPSLDLRRKDARFVRARRALDTLTRLEGSLAAPSPRAQRALRRAFSDLRTLDAHLAALVGALVRCRVDASLLRDVLAEVRAEVVPGQVALDALALEAPDPAPSVEVFRVDLFIVLKNVVRNALLAVGRGEAPRRVRIDVRTELEVSGEEHVVVRVHDTSSEELTTEMIRGRGVGSGLGLVTFALARYDGSITVERGDGGFAKAVAVRFFRAFDDGDAPQDGVS